MLAKLWTDFELDVFLVLIFTVITLSILGIFLILKKVAMIVDAISHSVLLGIVLVFLVSKDLNSPFLIIGAALMGVLTFFSIEFINKNSQFSQADANIGIIFTFFFSIAIIIISIWTRDAHIDNDAVFLGNIELTDIKQLYKIIPILILNLAFIIIFYKEIKIFIFDPTLAIILGFSSILMNYLLITLVSLTAVIAFDVVGSIMAIACMIGPAATALLLTKKLLNILYLSVWLSIVSASLGYFLGILLDLPVSGLISTLILFMFLLVLFFEPKSGVIAKIINNYCKKQNFMLLTLLMHLQNHQNHKDQQNLINKIKIALKWHSTRYNRCVKKALKQGYIQIQTSKILLTPEGQFFLNKYIKNCELQFI